MSNKHWEPLARLQSFSTHKPENVIVHGKKHIVEGWISRTYEDYKPAPVVYQVVQDVPSLRLVSFWTASEYSIANVSQGLDLESASPGTRYSSDTVVVSLDLEGYNDVIEVKFKGEHCTATSNDFCRSWKTEVPDFVAPTKPKFVPGKTPTSEKGSPHLRKNVHQ